MITLALVISLVLIPFLFALMMVKIRGMRQERNDVELVLPVRKVRVAAATKLPQMRG